MTKTTEEEKELLEIKQRFQKELLELKREITKDEHEQKMSRLEKLLEITRAGGIPQNIEKQAESAATKD